MNNIRTYLEASWQESSKAAKIVCVSSSLLTAGILGSVGYDRIANPLAYNIHAGRNTTTFNIGNDDKLEEVVYLTVIGSLEILRNSGFNGKGKNTVSPIGQIGIVAAGTFYSN